MAEEAPLMSALYEARSCAECGATMSRRDDERVKDWVKRKNCGRACYVASRKRIASLTPKRPSERTDVSEYYIWRSMKARCSNPNNTAYHCYGGRGITVCERWKSFDNFLQDMGRRPTSEHSIERADVNGNYEPSNCRWGTRAEQNRNRRTTRIFKAFGKAMILPDWAVETGINLQTLRHRIYRGKWPITAALTLPPGSLPMGFSKAETAP